MNRLEVNENKGKVMIEKIFKEVTCFSCDKPIEVKFVNRSRDYSQKNN